MPNAPGDASQNNPSRKDDAIHLPQKNALEWAVFAVSAALVLGTLGYLIFSAATTEKTPPVLSVALGQAQPAASQFRVPVTISNDGNQTATGVQIEVTLDEGKTSEEKASFTAPYLPRHSKREGAVLFKSDPRKGKLQARVLGYVDP